MRFLAIVAICFAAGAAFADANDTVKVYTLSVKERMQNLELINVTAEKAAAEDAEPLDEELLQLLEEIEALEETESGTSQ